MSGRAAVPGDGKDSPHPDRHASEKRRSERRRDSERSTAGAKDGTCTGSKSKFLSS